MFSKIQQLREEREEGFTLIELLVVILIIGILAAIAIPAFLNQRKSAVDSSVQSDVKNAVTSIETWITKQGATEVTVPDAATLDIQTSEGTNLTIEGTSFHYHVTGTNDGGDVAANGGYLYDSAQGGFVDSFSDTVPTVTP